MPPKTIHITMPGASSFNAFFPPLIKIIIIKPTVIKKKSIIKIYIYHPDRIIDLELFQLKSSKNFHS
mgnify:CR=1 FL=1